VAPVSSFEAIAEESGASRVIACLDARMHEVYYAALERSPEGWREVVPGECVAPAAATLPPGEDWIGCGSGFAAFPDFLRNKMARVIPGVHPTAIAVARLAAARLLAGKGVDAAEAHPAYLREKVAFTQVELAQR
jgi:tRNA threonylcarbamoyladenosine biosynthesis protein TsaB